MAMDTDLRYLLDAATGAATVLDELTLLRASLRAYLDGMTAEAAAKWAAEQLSNSLSNS